MADSIDYIKAAQDWDGWRAGLRPEHQDIIDYLSSSSIPEERRARRSRFLGTYYLADRLNFDVEEISQRFDLFRDAFTTHPGGFARTLPPRDDNEFLQLIVTNEQGRLLTRERVAEAQRSAYLAAADPESPGLLPSLAEFEKADADMPAEAADAFWNRYRLTSRQIQPFRPMLRGFADAVERGMKGTALDSDEQTIAQGREAIIDMPEETREIALRGLWQLVQRRGEANAREKGGRGTAGAAWQTVQGIFTGPLTSGGRKFLQQTGEAGYRMVTSGIGGLARQQVMLGLEHVPESGEVTTTFTKIQTPADALQYTFVKKNEFTADYGAWSAGAGGLMPAAPILPAGQRRVLSPDETALIRDAKARMVLALNIGREIEDMGNEIDPTPNLFARTLGTSGAMLGLAVATRGMSFPVSMQIYRGLEYDDLSRKYPQMSEGDKALISTLSAGIPAAGDALEIKAFDSLPGIKGLLTDGLTKTLAARALGRVAGTYAVENAVEGGQDIATPLLMAALKRDVPGFDWDRELKEWWHGRAEVALGMLPLTLIGAGAASFRDYRGSLEKTELNADPARTGRTEADRAAIVDALTSGDFARADTLMRESLSRRDPAIAAEAQQRAEADGRELHRHMLLAGISLRRERGRYQVIVRDGTPARFDDPAQAMAAVHDHLSELGFEPRRSATGAAENADAAAEGTRLQLSGKGKPVTLTPLPVISSSTNALPVVQEKQQVRASGYSTETVNGLIDKFYKPEAYESLRGTNPIFLVAPTTSGYNTIPFHLAEKLREEFGGEVIREEAYAAPISDVQAKDRKGYLQKLATPSRFTIQSDLAERIGNRPVVIVDDILTSGETLDGLQMDLHAAGVKVRSVATLVAHDAGRAVGDASLQALARKISRLTGGTSVNRILEDLRLAHGHSRAKLIQNADDDVRDHQTGRDALEHIRGQAEAVRSALRDGAQRGSPRTQLYTRGVQEGPGVLHGVPPLEAGRENGSQSGGATARPGRVADGGADLSRTIADSVGWLNRQLPGLIHEKTHIFSSAEELLNSDYAKQHPFTEKERADIASAEGFFDKSTGATVIIAGNIALRNGESASQAFARVVIHERVGHDGINLLLGDKRFKQRWEAVMGRIPKTELDAIAAEEGYQDLANKPHELALEWLARRTESDPTLLEKPGPVREMWEAFKEVLRRVGESFGWSSLDSRDFDAEVQSLLHQARGAAVKGKGTVRRKGFSVARSGERLQFSVETYNAVKKRLDKPASWEEIKRGHSLKHIWSLFPKSDVQKGTFFRRGNFEELIERIAGWLPAMGMVRDPWGGSVNLTIPMVGFTRTTSRTVQRILLELRLRVRGLQSAHCGPKSWSGLDRPGGPLKMRR